MNRKKIYIILAVLVAGGVLLQFATLPMIRTSKATKIELAERKAYLSDRKEIVKRIIELEEEKKEWESQVERLDLALPTDLELASVIFQFQNFAMDSGLIMKEVGHNEQPSAAIAGGWELSITSKLLGNYSSIKSFFNKLEENLRIVDIQRIDIGMEATSSSSSKDGTTKIETVKSDEQFFSSGFTAKLYYFPKEIKSIAK